MRANFSLGESPARYVATVIHDAQLRLCAIFDYLRRQGRDILKKLRTQAIGDLVHPVV